MSHGNRGRSAKNAPRQIHETARCLTRRIPGRSDLGIHGTMTEAAHASEARSGGGALAAGAK
jgi:hypothetical protein